MITQAIGLGLVVSFFFLEIVGLSAGGLIVPGYLALYWDNPLRIFATLFIAVASYAILKFLMNYVILYSRRRFMAAVLIGLGVGWLLDTIIFRFPAGYKDMRAIGFIVPGLIANDMVKQGIINTVISVLIVSAIVRLILMGIS